MIHRRLWLLIALVAVTGSLVLLVSPNNPVIIWTGMIGISLTTAAFFGLFVPYRYQVYLGAVVLFCLYLQWQNIMSFEFVGYALLGLIMSEVIFQVLRKLW